MSNIVYISLFEGQGRVHLQCGRLWSSEDSQFHGKAESPLGTSGMFIPPNPMTLGNKTYKCPQGRTGKTQDPLNKTSGLFVSML